MAQTLVFSTLSGKAVYSNSAVTRDNKGDLAYAIERCSGGFDNGRELLETAKRAAKRKLGASF